MKIEKLIQSVTELEANGNMDSDMYCFTVLKNYLTGTISYSFAMKELTKDSGAYSNLVRGLINKYKIIGE